MTEKQFSTPHPLSITNPLPLAKQTNKKKLSNNIRLEVFVFTFEVISVDMTRVISVLVSFPSPESEMEPSNRREMEESY